MKNLVPVILYAVLAASAAALHAWVALACLSIPPAVMLAAALKISRP